MLRRVITVLCGGVGAARLLRVLQQHVEPADITAVVNVGDDLVLHGLTICPDLDTITYTVTGRNNETLGWGLQGETWRVMEQLDALGGERWFGLGDLDLATHLYRSQRLSQGASKTTVAAELAKRMGLAISLLPVTDDPVATTFDTEIGPLSFQEYFVKHHHSVRVDAISFIGAPSAVLSPLSRRALEQAERIIIAPSNPLISIGPMLAIEGISALLQERRRDVVAVSPIINGAALKGPADRLLAELGFDVSCVGVAHYYQGLIGTLVIDEVDAHLAPAIRDLDIDVIVTSTIMGTPAADAALAAAVLG
jgi:LPPG:FO 2-phospho-L-lactate transferase